MAVNIHSVVNWLVLVIKCPQGLLIIALNLDPMPQIEIDSLKETTPPYCVFLVFFGYRKYLRFGGAGSDGRLL